MVHGARLLVWGDMGTASTVAPAAAGPISPLCFCGLCSWESCIALAQGKGRTGTQDKVLQHFLAIPGFGITSWCSSVFIVMLCAPAKPAGNAQDIDHLPPTPGYHGLSLCSTSGDKLLEQHETISPCCPWHSATSHRSSEASMCSWHSQPPACCSHHQFCVVRPETTAASSSRKAGKVSGCGLFSPGTCVLLTRVNRHVSA